MGKGLSAGEWVVRVGEWVSGCPKTDSGDITIPSWPSGHDGAVSVVIT